VGFCFKDIVESFFGGSLFVVGVCLCVTALLLCFAYISNYKRAHALSVNRSNGRDITWLDAFIIGCAQAVAVLPGLSRSGTTIATGIILGNKSDKVASFSFFMVIIPILGEALLNVKDLLTEPAAAEQSVGFLPLAIGFIAAFVVGCLACKWMLSIVKKGKLVWFAVYCAAMGILCMCW
jgi:undecaprenyl-diphosphatase